MPDMVHSTAYEANIYNYYYYNTWGTEEEYKEFAEPREPVTGTIPRGFSTVHYESDPAARLASMKEFEGEKTHTSIAYTPNGAVPYYYEDTEDERARAMREILENPFPITEDGLARGEELYNLYCGICHGEKGDGLGYLVREEDPARGITAGVYPAAPANFLQDTFYNSSNGRYYHSIMYGKNVMGAYADKLSYEERWQVIHWIRALQAKELGLAYNAEENTYTNNDYDVPGAGILAEIEAKEAAEDAEMHNEEHGEEHGSEEHGGEHHGDDH
jgi:mono/diheme cytochrome c family protein